MRERQVKTKERKKVIRGIKGIFYNEDKERPMLSVGQENTMVSIGLESTTVSVELEGFSRVG
jgi:hypothetical protein